MTRRSMIYLALMFSMHLIAFSLLLRRKATFSELVLFAPLGALVCAIVWALMSGILKVRLE